MPNDAIMLLAHGSPGSMAALPAFLSNVRGGRPVPDEEVASYRERYRAIGGLSPLSAITARIATALSEHAHVPVYVGTRHGMPSIGDAVHEAIAAGSETVTAICLTPYSSRMTVGGYRRQLDEALAATPDPIAVRFVEDWHLEPAYLTGLEATLQEGFDRVPTRLHDGTAVVFSAHSLPERVLALGDPYPAQLEAAARWLASRLGLEEAQWSMAYQSAPASRERWLGPSLASKLRALAEAGEAAVLVAPIGFVADNVEVLYDLDVEANTLARGLGLHFARAPLLNDAPALIEALAHAVTGATRQTAA
jgi:protoporphyrin/coproporphyrin ferrochelatase